MKQLALRNFQEEIVISLRKLLVRVKSVLIQVATGAGKTIIGTYVIKGTSSNLKVAWFICHREELIYQTSKTFESYGISHSFISSDLTFLPEMLVQIASIDTLKNRLSRLKAPAVAVIDECHHSSAPGWALVIRWLKQNGTIIIGLSATPERLDGVGLDEFFEDMIVGPSPAWLIENGYLSKYSLFCPDNPDMQSKGKRAFQREASKKMPKLIGNAIEHWRREADGLSTIAFCKDVANSEQTAHDFRTAGINAMHLDANTPKKERRKIIQSYAAGEVKLLSNVALFGEGFDLSAIAQTDATIDCLLDLDPTQSFSWHRQKQGRVLRPREGKHAIILDHAGNALIHGWPDDPYEWTLLGEKEAKEAGLERNISPPIICGDCFNAMRRPVPEACPHCGSIVAKKEEILVAAPGQLRKQTEADRRARIEKKKRDQAACASLDELVAFARRQGYKNPLTWASTTFGKRHGKRT